MTSSPSCRKASQNDDATRATVNGEKIIYINERLSRAVNDINIQPDEFIKLVKQKYNIAVNENRIMKKKLIKLTESDIHNIVMNTVRSLIKEEPLMPADVQDNETDMTLDDHKTTGNYTNDARILLATLATSTRCSLRSSWRP